MYELNKQKFGAFVSALRKERGYTQKELAQKLFISDKAVSKWETGMSVPDVSLLVPLSELLGVSVTELLMCEKMEQPAQMDTCQVESLVKTAIAYADETPQRAYQSDRKKAWLYAVSLAVGVLWMFLHWKNGSLTEAVRLCAGFGAGFGLYFFFFVRTKLPSFYDENSISGFYDGPVRMNLAGVQFNNRELAAHRARRPSLVLRRHGGSACRTVSGCGDTAGHLADDRTLCAFGAAARRPVHSDVRRRDQIQINRGALHLQSPSLLWRP